MNQPDSHTADENVDHFLEWVRATHLGFSQSNGNIQLIERRVRALYAALRLLVECKEVKDRLDGWEAGSTQEMAAMDEWYTENKPRAWKMARAALNMPKEAA